MKRQAQRVFPFVLSTLVALSILAGLFVATGGARRVGFGRGLPTDPATDLAAGNAGASAAFHSTMDGSVGVIEKLPADSVVPPGSPLLLPVGAPAPSFSLRSASGESVSLSDLRGKVVLLEFSSTRSPQCQAEAEHLVAIRAGSSARLVFLALNAEAEDAASVQAFGRHFAIPYPTLLDPGKSVAKAYGVQVYPSFYIVDRVGLVAWRSDGEQPDALLMKKLAETLGR